MTIRGMDPGFRVEKTFVSDQVLAMCDRPVARCPPVRS
jgi:hypothetical protein